MLDNMGQLHLAMADKAAKDGDSEKAKELRAKGAAFMKQAYDAKPDQVSSTYYYAKLLHEDGNDAKAREIMAELKKIPTSAILQISAKDIEALAKKIG